MLLRTLVDVLSHVLNSCPSTYNLLNHEIVDSNLVARTRIKLDN